MVNPSAQTVRRRIQRGWDPDVARTTPVDPKASARGLAGGRARFERCDPALLSEIGRKAGAWKRIGPRPPRGERLRIGTEERTYSQWAQWAGITVSALRHRLRRGVNPTEAVRPRADKRIGKFWKRLQ